MNNVHAAHFIKKDPGQDNSHLKSEGHETHTCIQERKRERNTKHLGFVDTRFFRLQKRFNELEILGIGGAFSYASQPKAGLMSGSTRGMHIKQFESWYQVRNRSGARISLITDKPLDQRNEPNLVGSGQETYQKFQSKRYMLTMSNNQNISRNITTFVQERRLSLRSPYGELITENARRTRNTPAVHVELDSFINKSA